MLSLYTSCNCVSGYIDMELVESLMNKHDIDVLVVGCRAQFDRCYNVIKTEIGNIGRCYFVDEVYAIIADRELDMKLVRMHLIDRHYEPNTLGNVQCLYPCPVMKCPHSYTPETINICCKRAPLTPSSIDPTYYFFGTVLILVMVMFAIVLIAVTK